LSVCFFLITIAVGRSRKSTIPAYVDFVLAYFLRFVRLIPLLGLNVPHIFTSVIATRIGLTSTSNL
jgi:hypothetical protein